MTASDHRPIPDDMPEEGDRCKYCGGPITWVGPSTVTDWEHVEADFTKPSADVAAVFGDQATALGAGQHFTCREADTIARFLVAHGHIEEAVIWIEGHSAGDEPTDAHGHCAGNWAEVRAYVFGSL